MPTYFICFKMKGFIMKIFQRVCACFFVSSIVVICLVILFPFVTHAEEIMEETAMDTEQNERLNSLEIRLEELGYQINEINGTLEEVQTSELSEQEERLLISEKLDLVIVALNDLINYDIEILTKADNSELLVTDYRVQVLDSFKQLNETSLQLSADTVSGNTLVSQLDDTVAKGNSDALEINAQNDEIANTRFLAIIGVIGIAIGAIFGVIFSSWFKGRK